MQTFATILFACLYCSVLVSPDANTPVNQFTAVSWNVDSGDADPHTIALRVAQMHGVDLWGLTEVRDERWAELLKRAAQENHPGQMAPILSPTGGSGRSLILYDAAQFELLGYFELDWSDQSWYRPDMGLRPALIAQLRHRLTGHEFFFMVNRFLPQWAAMQAVKVNEWTARQIIPVIAVGSYYFQYCLGPQAIQCEGQKGLKLMAYDGVFQWIKPENPIKTFDHEANTIEDFVFVANAAGKLLAQSTIIVEPNDFPDSSSTSDHRPIRTTFIVLTAAPEMMLRHRIRQQILKIRSDIDDLDALVHQLPD
jgi:hypothetical protein